MKVVGELKNVLLELFLDPRIHHTVDIVVEDIPKTYGMWLSRDWSKKLLRATLPMTSHICCYHSMADQIRLKLLGNLL